MLGVHCALLIHVELSIEMIYFFQQYQFDSEKLVLSSQGTILNLRNNEAKLLAFFLQHAQVVLSKEEILNAVWADKVVGDQVVFQSISNLRQLFGDDAIRTFPKKGYQWQILGNSSNPSEQVNASNTHADIAPVLPSFQFSSHRGVIAAIAFLMFIGMFFFWRNSALKSTNASSTNGRLTQPQTKATSTAPGSIELQIRIFELKPNHSEISTADIQADLRKYLQMKPEFNVSEAMPDLTEAQLLTTPSAYWVNSKSQKATSTKVSITGRLRETNEIHHLDLLIQGKENRWQIHLQHRDLNQLQQSTVDLLARILPINLLWESKDQRLVNAQLQLILNEYPDDLNIQRALLLNLINIGDAQTALIRSNELLTKALQQNDQVQQVTALQIQARIALNEMKLEEGEAILDRALKIAQESGDLQLQARCLEKYFSLYYAKHQFEPLEEKLLRALQLARKQSARALEAELMMALTVSSYKFSLTTKQNYYFEQTKTLFDQLQLAPEKYTDLAFFSAINSSDERQSERLLIQALSQYKPQQKNAAKERIQTQLVQFYLRNKRISQALAVVDQEQSSSNTERYLRASILAQTKDQSAAVALAERVYQDSKLGGEFLLTLDTALLLAQLYQSQGRSDQVRHYLAIIDKNATPIWRKQHQAQIEALEKQSV